MKRALTEILIGVVLLTIAIVIITILSIVADTSFEYTAILFLLSVYVSNLIDGVWK
jgi:hypothetical protein